MATTKQDIIHAVVINEWTKRQLFVMLVRLIISDLDQKYQPVRSRVRYIVFGT